MKIDVEDLKQVHNSAGLSPQMNSIWSMCTYRAPSAIFLLADLSH